MDAESNQTFRISAPTARLAFKNACWAVASFTILLQGGAHSHMASLLLDFRSSYRQMRRNIKIAGVSILTISCSIGIMVAAFSVIETELVRPLPYDHPEEIVILQGRSTNGQPMLESYLHHLDVQRET